MDLRALIRQVPDFPKKGINFIDITTVLRDKDALQYVVKSIADNFRTEDVDLVAGVESRGFILAAPVAYELQKGLVIVRKPGKLPAAKLKVEYELEYGIDALEIHRDAVAPGQKVLLVDDLLATGGTIAAVADLIKKLGGIVAGYAFMVELSFLNGRERLGPEKIVSLVSYEK
ncbi:MAG TPA: adenine phosphoribosyltransferase [Firmicutes bacterium]|nr:adenine phosphoribosyltransferase [Bacillota bacterium]